MMNAMQKSSIVLSLSVMVIAAGCQAPGQPKPELGAGIVTAGMVVEQSPLAEGAGPQDLPDVDILEVTPEMVAFIEANIRGARNRYARMKRLIYAIMGSDSFELIYDDTTRTARQTFEDRRGNCLSFTNMFIAMARYLEIQASYQEVEIPPDWSLAGESFLFSQHVNVHVDLGADEIRIVDFNMYDFNTTYERRIIPDQRARAHYFSNIGVDHMLAGDRRDAYLNFRRAIREDGAFAPAWINMGILHRREKLPGYAEAAYSQALEIDQFNPVAMSNLASLYDEAGMTEKAQEYRDWVRSHRMKNPYYRYYLARDAVAEGDYQTAIGHLNYAIRHRENESRFYSLLSISHLMSGDKAAAERWMRKAEAVAVQEADREKYHHKLEWLMSQGSRR
jgi:tetratricopeptide (TPR) repeat protein